MMMIINKILKPLRTHTCPLHRSPACRHAIIILRREEEYRNIDAGTQHAEETEKNDLVPTKVVEADSWKIELGDVQNKHKEFIKGIEKAFSIIQHQERSYGDRGLSPVSVFRWFTEHCFNSFYIGPLSGTLLAVPMYKIALLDVRQRLYQVEEKNDFVYAGLMLDCIHIFYIIFSLISVLAQLELTL